MYNTPYTEISKLARRKRCRTRRNIVTRDTALRLLALLALLAMLLVVTVVPGMSILDLTIDVGTKVFALYAAYMVWAALTVLLMNDSITQWTTHRQAKA